MFKAQQNIFHHGNGENRHTICEISDVNIANFLELLRLRSQGLSCIWVVISYMRILRQLYLCIAYIKISGQLYDFQGKKSTAPQ